MAIFSGTMRTFGMLLLGCAAMTSLAQDTTVSEKENAPSDATQELAEKRFKEFLQQAGEIELAAKNDGARLKLREQPLQKFSSEGNTFGSVFVWKEKGGRPGAIGTIGSLPINGNDFGFIELHWLLSDSMKPVTIGKAYPKLWKATGEDLDLRLIVTAPAPVESAQGRLVQMRNLAREFSATMSNEQGLHELRLLPQPLYRYEDPTQEEDGAIFALVWTIGTDPELLLHLQTVKKDGHANWYWQPIRFTWRAINLKYRNESVWSAEEFLSRNELMQSGPYITTLTEPIK